VKQSKTNQRGGPELRTLQGSRIQMWRRHSCLRVKAAFQPPVLLEHGTGKSREPAGWKTCATNAALPTHRDQGFKRASPGHLSPMSCPRMNS